MSVNFPQCGMVRIYRDDGTPEGRTLGSGFLAHSDRLVVTCAHVLEAKLTNTDVNQPVLDVNQPVLLEFYSTRQRCTARVLPQYWRPSTAEDVAVLQVLEHINVTELTEANRVALSSKIGSDLPVVLPLGCSNYASESDDLHTFGFPRSKPVEGLPGLVTVLGPTKQNGFDLFSVRSSEVSSGFSGAPVWNSTNETVVGMLVSIVQLGTDIDGRQPDTAFFIPIETITSICDVLALAVKATTIPAEAASPFRPILRCDPEEINSVWHWEHLDFPSTFVLGWSESEIFLWDTAQSAIRDQQSDKIPILTLKDARDNRYGTLIAAGMVPVQHTDMCRVYALTHRLYIVTMTIDRETKQRTDLTVITPPPEIAIDHLKTTIGSVSGQLTNESAFFIYVTHPEEHTDEEVCSIRIASRAAGQWKWSVNLLNAPRHALHARFEASGHLLLVATEGPKFHLYRSTGELIDRESPTQLSHSESTHSKDSRSLHVTRLESLSRTHSAQPYCWYGLCSDNSIFCASIDPSTEVFQVHALQSQGMSMIAARHVDGWPQLVLADDYRDDASHAQWILRMRIWKPGKPEPEARTIHASTSRHEIIAVLFEESTERILILWRSRGSSNLKYTSCFPADSPNDHAVAESRELETSIPLSNAILLSQRGLAAVCNDHEVVLCETQGFEILAQASLKGLPCQLPFRWLHEFGSIPRLITTSETEACIWEFSAPFSCRTLRSDIPDHNCVKLTRDGLLAYAHSTPAEIVVETLAGQLLHVFPVPDSYLEHFTDIRALHVRNEMLPKEVPGSAFCIVVQCRSCLLFVSQQNEWRSALLNKAIDDDICDVSIDNEFTAALVWDSTRLYKIDICEPFEPEVICNESVAGSVMSAGGQVLYWGGGRVMLGRACKIAHPDAIAFLSEDSHFLVFTCNIPGDETIYDVLRPDKTIPPFKYGVERVRGDGPGRLNDVVSIKGPDEGYAICRRQLRQKVSMIELMWPDAQKSIPIFGAPFNALLLSPSSGNLLAFGDDLIMLWSISFGAPAEPLGRIRIDRAVAMQTTRDCISIDGPNNSVGFVWVRKDERLCVAEWNLPCRVEVCTMN